MVSIKKSLVTVAYGEIYRRIVSLKYEPGRQLYEQNLMDDLSIGRTPIREALCNLASDMLIESQPNKGVIVRPVTLQNTKAVFAALETLELGIVKQAMINNITSHLQAMEQANASMTKAVEDMDIYALVDSNNSFHTSFSRCSNNVYLVEALRKVRCEANRLAYLSFANGIKTEQSLRAHYKRVMAQHDEIILYLREQREEELKKVLLQHIIDFKKRIIEYLAS
jgi:DNA-binding GntR family transcriptional regulator